MRRLYYSDNLPILRAMSDESVDLIYLDPPFNSNRAYNIIYPGDLGQVTAFEDTWAWSSECDVHLDTIKAQPQEIGQVLPALVSGMGKIQLSAYLVNMAVRLVELHRILKPTGSLYLHCDPTAGHYLKIVLDATFGRKEFRNEIIWYYNSGARKERDFGRRHDFIFRYSRSPNYFVDFDCPEAREPYSPDINIPPSKKHYYDPRGKVRDDVWRLPIIPQNDKKERLGFPTQKPLKLLDRIIRTSSRHGDIVLDPFCGCGTAIEAAENSGRQWIGIDITYAAIAAIQERFRRNRIDIWDKIQISGKPATVKDVDTTLLDKASPQFARKEFEKFCVSVIGGLPNNKMGADGGIDGRIPLEGDKQAIVSVKSGDVSVSQIRELKGILNDRRVAGVFVTRHPPTRPMREFAKQAGIVKIETAKGDLFQVRPFPVIQIITLEELLAGQRPNLPLLRTK